MKDALTGVAGRRRVLVVRPDGAGDVLLAGPVVRAVAERAEVTLLVSAAGAEAAALLPGVSAILVWACPWAGYQAPAVDAQSVADLVARLHGRRFDAALILTSYHQSALPTALVLRLAGIGWIGAISEDYPGSLLDLRHPDPGGHEVPRSLSLAAAAGFPAGPGGQTLAVRRPLPPVHPSVPWDPYTVVHPGASVPARAPDPDHARELVRALVDAGRTVVVTGSHTERALTAHVSDGAATDLGGRTGLAGLAAVLAGADCTVTGNTGPAHLSAAVGTPVVSLFSPVVPAASWGPWGVLHRILGDQDAACALSRARDCPVAGHPCLTGISPASVVQAVDDLVAAAAKPRGLLAGRLPWSRPAQGTPAQGTPV